MKRRMVTFVIALSLVLTNVQPAFSAEEVFLDEGSTTVEQNQDTEGGAEENLDVYETPDEVADAIEEPQAELLSAAEEMPVEDPDDSYEEPEEMQAVEYANAEAPGELFENFDETPPEDIPDAIDQSDEGSDTFEEPPVETPEYVEETPPEVTDVVDEIPEEVPEVVEETPVEEPEVVEETPTDVPEAGVEAPIDGDESVDDSTDEDEFEDFDEILDEDEEEEEEEEEEISYPAKAFGPMSINSVTVQAFVDEGVFPEGTEMVLSGVSNRERQEIMDNANELTADNEEVVDVIAVDITFVYKDEEIQPKDGLPVYVEMWTTREVMGDNHMAVHVEDTGDVEVVSDASSSGTSIEATDFSIYAIIGTEYVEEVEQLPRYTYIFYLDGEEIDTQIVKDGDSLVEPSIPDWAEGQRFVGWKVRETEELISFDTPIPVSGDADVTYHVDAVYDDEYEVIFYTDEEKSSVLNVTAASNHEEVSTANYALPNNEMQKFDGWYDATDPDKTKLETVTIEGRDVELLPRYLDGVWVFYNSLGGTYVEPHFLMVGSTTEEPAPPTLNGYVLKGWYTTQESAENLVEEDRFDFSSEINETKTLYAGWEPVEVTYQVAVWTENANDDGYSLYSTIVRSGLTGSEVTTDMLTDIVPTENGGVPCFNINVDKSDEHVCTINGDGTTIRDVYFDRIRYTVGYMYNGEPLFTIPDMKYGEIVFGSKYEEQVAALGEPLPGNGWSRDWLATSKQFLLDGTVNQTTEHLYTSFAADPLAAYNSYMRDYENNQGYLVYNRENHRMYATEEYFWNEWLDDETTPEGAEIKEFMGVKYYFDHYFSGSYVNSNNIGRQYSLKPFKGYIAEQISTGEIQYLEVRPGFTRAYINANDPTNIYHLRQTYNLSFDESNLDSVDILYEDKLSAYEPEGYVIGETTRMVGEKTYLFNGWKTADGVVVDFSTDRMPKENIILYGMWEPITHVVTFDYDNGTPNDTVEVEDAEHVTRPADPQKEGSVFVGWKTADGEWFEFDTHIVHDTYLTAIYHTEGVSFTVAYNAGEYGTFSKTDSHHYADGAKAIILGAPTVTDDTRVFIGWQINGSGTLYRTGLFDINMEDADEDGVITLVAQYGPRPEKTTVTYDPNGGNGTAQTFTEVGINNDVTEVKSISDVNFTPKLGCHFVHWNTAADDSGEAFHAEEIIALNITDGIDRVLYAIWAPDTIDIEGTKTWDDANDQDGKRPESITINLLANGDKIDSATVTEDDEWKYSFTGIPEYEDEVKIVYTVTEDPVPGYTTTTSEDGLNFTNKHVPEKTSVEGTKTWDDADDQDGKRPSKITFNLLANGDKVDSVTVTEKDEWKYSFKDLDKYAGGKEIVYTVTEDPVPGYTTTTSEDGRNFTNKHVPEKIDVEGTKTWDDADDQDGKRPESITVNLFADGKKKDSVTVTEKDEWKYSFKDLDKYSGGKEILYEITEDPVPGYEAKVDDFNITNKHVPEKIDVEGKKMWSDANDQDGKRPSKITVNLLADGKKVDSVTVTERSGWKYSFKDLDKYAAGKEIVYTVSEDSVPGYETQIDGFDITNKHVPEMINIEGTKTWNDNNNKAGKRPASITVNLLANGKKVDSVKVTAEDDWKYYFNVIPKYENGKEIEYSVSENPVPGYATKIVGFNITNRYIPEEQPTTEVTKKRPSNPSNPGGSPKGYETGKTANYVTNPPKTGDETNLTLYILLMLISLLGIAIYVFRLRKMKK